MVAAFFFILAVLLAIVRFNVSAQVRRTASKDMGADYVQGAQRSLPFFTYATLACLGLAVLALLAEVLMELS
jgi:hypothetical protein